MPIIPPDLSTLPPASGIASSTSTPKSPTRPAYATWCIVGASRGIGLEFVRQLLDRGDQVVAAVRDPYNAQRLWPVSTSHQPGRCTILQCDVTNESSIDTFVERVKAITELRLDCLVLNAGILQYPNRAIEVSFSSFTQHLTTNTIGPVIIASKLLRALSYPIQKVVFISSDSGSALAFRDFEDGFAAYAASKAALNQMVRHMSAELCRAEKNAGIESEEKRTTVLAIHPGEVNTDMADIEVAWEVEGIISAEESVKGVLGVIESKGPKETGTFWTWDGREHPW